MSVQLCRALVSEGRSAEAIALLKMGLEKGTKEKRIGRAKRNVLFRILKGRMWDEAYIYLGALGFFPVIFLIFCEAFLRIFKKKSI